MSAFAIVGCFCQATASVDPETDAFLTDMISHIFADVTTITIAHRLQTIMGADQVIVVDKGAVAEHGTFTPSDCLWARDQSCKVLADVRPFT